MKLDKLHFDELKRKNGLESALAVLADYLPIVLVFFLLWNHTGNWALYLGAWCVLGIQYHRLALLGHEGAHRLLFRSRRLNDMVTDLLLFNPLGLTGAGYRAWHFAHHRALGTPEDPELAIKRGWRYSMPKSRAQFAGMFVADCLGLGAAEIWRVMIACRPRSAPDWLRLSSYWGALGLTSAYLERLDLLCLHVWTTVTLLMALSRLRMWCEHSALAETHRIESNPFLSYAVFPHNTWLHFEHHKWPSIPCHNLRKARELEQQEPVRSLSQLLTQFGGRPRRPDSQSLTGRHRDTMEQLPMLGMKNYSSEYMNACRARR